MALDLSKPHGVIYGDDHARYEQEGVLYDATGREVCAKVDAAPAEEKQPAPVRRRGGSHKTPVTQ